MNNRQNELIARTESELAYLIHRHFESHVDYKGEELNEVAKKLHSFFRKEVQNFLNDF